MMNKELQEMLNAVPAEDKKTMLECVTEAALAIVGVTMDIARDGTAPGCPPFSCRIKPESPRDWVAVHNFIAHLIDSHTQAAAQVLVDTKTAAIQARLAPDQIVSDEVFMTQTQNIAMFHAFAALLKAHTTIVNNGGLNADNADLHYDRMRGSAELILHKKHHDVANGRR
jgi:hypothetical protein